MNYLEAYLNVQFVVKLSDVSEFIVAFEDTLDKSDTNQFIVSY